MKWLTIDKDLELNSEISKRDLAFLKRCCVYIKGNFILSQKCSFSSVRTMSVLLSIIELNVVSNFTIIFMNGKFKIPSVCEEEHCFSADLISDLRGRMAKLEAKCE